MQNRTSRTTRQQCIPVTSSDKGEGFIGNLATIAVTCMKWKPHFKKPFPLRRLLVENRSFFQYKLYNFFFTGVNSNRWFFFPGSFLRAIVNDTNSWLQLPRGAYCKQLWLFKLFIQYFLLDTLTVCSDRCSFVTVSIVSNGKVNSYKGHWSLSPLAGTFSLIFQIWLLHFFAATQLDLCRMKSGSCS